MVLANSIHKSQPNPTETYLYGDFPMEAKRIYIYKEVGARVGARNLDELRND